jgi:hypothetical protein
VSITNEVFVWEKEKMVEGVGESVGYGSQNVTDTALRNNGKDKWVAVVAPNNAQ